MFKPMTKQEIAKHEAKMIARAQDWRTRLFPDDSEKLAQAIWNRYGYPTAVRNGKVLIQSGREIIAEV